MGTSTQKMNKSDIKLIAVLERTGGFASAQELHQILRREGDGIGLTTVYRALQSLVDDKIVDLLRREDGEAIYRLCGDTHHHHLVCKSCGDTVEIEGGAIEKWAKTMAEEFGFRDVGHTAEIFGICSEVLILKLFRTLRSLDEVLLRSAFHKVLRVTSGHSTSIKTNSA
jgi:Fur family transcriptional regulator, ferric uptake regulator